MVPGRTCSVEDWVADTVGALLGAAVFNWLAERFGATHSGLLGRDKE